MKMLIVSDTHGRHGNLDVVLEREKGIDVLIHLGDVEGDEHYIESVVKCCCSGVSVLSSALSASEK